MGNTEIKKLVSENHFVIIKASFIGINEQYKIEVADSSGNIIEDIDEIKGLKYTYEAVFELACKYQNKNILSIINPFIN